MRDQVNSGHFVVQQTAYSAGSKITTYNNVYSLDRIKHRADIVKTVPENGKFVYPTSYLVFDSSHTGNSYDCYFDFDDPFFGIRNSRRFWGSTHNGACLFTNVGMYYGVGGYPHAPAVPYAVRQEARAKLTQAAQNGEFDVGQFVGEARQTYSQVYEAARDLAAAYRSFRHGNYALCAKWLKMGIPKVPSNWLAWRYGWRLLMQDAYDAMKVIQDGVQQVTPAVTITHRDSTFVTPPFKVAPDNCPLHCEGMFLRGVKLSATFRVVNPTAYYLDRFGLLNPASLAWNLTPWSFVVDWFFNIGDFLSALSLPLTCDFIHGYETHYVRTAWSATRQDPKMKGVQSTSYYRLRAMSRQPLVDWPIPLPYIPTGITGKHIADLLALLWTLRK